MKCFGDKTKTFHCKVVLLDEQELIQEVQETTSGQDLLDTVYQHLNLIETAYFGLRFIDPSNQTHWLDPNKRLSKQLKGTSPYTLYFSVKFYAADPTKLVEEITRYQFFLQTKQDILQGRLPVSTELVSELGSFAVQSELGDYDPRRHSPGYVSEFRFATNQTVDLENKIADLHKKLVGYVPSKAELCYLEKVKWLDMYGVDLHSVLGEDSTEYFLGLTPSGIIVLRNKVKVGNYFWPRITKVYFRGRFFMLRVKDKNNSENTYGFETPSKSACKHLWQCCVEHHAFFRLTQAAGTSPQAIFSLGSKYSGRTEKDAVSDAKVNSRPQTEFARTPSRRYQRRIVEGANDTPRVDDTDHKPETRTIVSLPGTVTPVSSHVYRSTSLTLAPRSDSPRSIRSAPHPSGLQHKGISAHFGSSTTRRVGRSGTRDESPGSMKSVSNGRAPEDSDRIARRTSSVESQSSVDSRGCTRSCSRHRRSRCRSSDGESEASSKCSSKGHRRHHHKHHHHRHRNHSDDSSDQHKHRRRRHRHRSSERPEPQLVESSGQWAKVQSGETPAKSNTATVRDLTSGYMPSGHEDTELDTSVHHHSSRRKHRKHRSPSEGKHKNYPEEIRRHIDFGLQNTEGLTEAQLKEIPYTKVETAKNVKIRYGSPKGKRHKSPKRSKSNSSDRKNQQQQQNDVKDAPNPHVQGTHNENYKNGSINGNDRGTMERIKNGKIPNENEYRNDNDSSIMNANIRPCPRTSQGLMGDLTTSRESSPRDERVASLRSSPQRDSSPLRNFQETGILQRTRRESPQSSPLCDYGPKSTMVNGQGRSYTPNGSNRSSYNNQSYTRDQTQHPINNINNYINTSENTHSQYQHHRNPHTGGVFLQPLHDSSHTQDEEEGEMSSGFVDSNSGGFMSPSPILIKNATLERGSQYTAVLKPQPSPQSSVTSGISIGSSSVSISNDSCLTRSSRSFQPSNNEYPSPSQSQDLSPPSSSPDPEITPYVDKHINPAPRSISRQNVEPFYMNARSSQCPVHANSQSNNYNNSRTFHEQNHYANDGLTQHSTNILIQYHDGSISGASSGYKTPTPTPRSSVISSIHSPDTSTHIVQSYGPAYANSHIVNSLKRASHLTNLSRPSSRSSTNSQKTYTTRDFRDNISTNNISSGKEIIPNYSSLPRKTMAKTFRRSTGSQTNLPSPDELQYDDDAHSNFSIKDKIAFHERQTVTTKPHDTLNNFLRAETSDSNSEIFKSRSALCSPLNGLEIREGSENVNSWQRDTNQSSESHWKVYNWDTGRNEENWSNSLGRNNLTQDLYNGQRSGDGSQFARRGSAGSLDLILSPLIQSALEHQQR